MAYPIKYIENNLVWNKDGECYAYYELVPYNYSFLSPEQKIQVHDSFRQLIAQNRDGKIHALQISTESSIRSAQERSKNEVTGKLKAVAYDKIDQQTDALISMIGENQVNYRFFIGFKLLLNDQEFSMKSLTVEAKNALSDFVYDVNHKLMGDFVSMSNDEILRFQKMEKLLENKISRRFKIRRLDKDDFGYLIEPFTDRQALPMKSMSTIYQRKSWIMKRWLNTMTWLSLLAVWWKKNSDIWKSSRKMKPSM
ncbi:hypothetical protein [Metamycoplasma hominis]|uniref:hypothetical protein n=1 Tax=Metamycoplasma hominis TaxID=2098 RepID=UPI004037B452